MNNTLPEHCLYVAPETGILVLIHKGERGYYPSTYETGNTIRNLMLADYFNEKTGVSKAQAEAMYAGSLLGWECPAADPSFYDDKGSPKLKKEAGAPSSNTCQSPGSNR